MLWQHGEKELEKFLEFLNCYHPTIKFTANYSWEEINFPGVSVRKKNNQLVTDLYVKPTDTHQYLHASSCHVYHSKRIYSENSFYHKRCNDLEVWLRERGYKLVRQQILKVCKHKRKSLLNDMKDKRNDLKLVFNIIYYPSFSNLKDNMSFLHLLLTPDQEHQKVFHKVPSIGFRRAKNLKDILVTAKVLPVQKNEGFCGPSKKSRCEICKHIVSIDSFKSTTTQRIYFIRPPGLTYSSENVVYLFTCKTCSKQDFPPRFNKYKCAHRNFLKRKKVKQESFEAHFAEVNHNGKDDWEVRLINQTDNVEDLRTLQVEFFAKMVHSFQPLTVFVKITIPN